jgi:hypothetical protein
MTKDQNFIVQCSARPEYPGHKSHARKRGIKSRYYLSSTLLQGEAERSGSVRRVPAAEIETLVMRSVRNHLKAPAAVDDRSLVDTHVARVEVRPEQLVIQLTPTQKTNGKGARTVRTFHVPWHKTPSKRRREILLPAGTPPQQARPLRSESRALLVASIARGPERDSRAPRTDPWQRCRPHDCEEMSSIPATEARARAPCTWRR